MPLTPGYGETPLPQDELTALLRDVVEVLECSCADPNPGNG
jgi:hypothetical protein